jgi:putative ABC transport system permease protein
MLKYYLVLALRSLKRNMALTVLIIAAISVGIGASMTTVTVFRAMSADPIPQKSEQVFTVQIDNWGPANRKGSGNVTDERLPVQVTYTDAMALMNANAARRQAAMYATDVAITPVNPKVKPFDVHARATFADFFPMFEVPFRFGAPWSSADDKANASVVVITPELNDKLFGGVNSVGEVVSVNGHEYRLVGVLDRWQPIPKFYDLNNDKYGKSEELFIPFNRAVDGHMESAGNFNCRDIPGEGWEGRVQSECVWIQFWAELPSAADVNRYGSLLNNYAVEQQRSGRFDWTAHTRLRNVGEWLRYQHVVTDEARILVLVSFSFLFVCLLNAMGLMLAKIIGRSNDISIRRAMGANRSDVFLQYFIEAGVIGMAGGLLGLAITALGLLGLRELLSEEIATLTHLSIPDVLITMGLAIAATVAAGLYPTWRATQLQPIWLLKAQ